MKIEWVYCSDVEEATDRVCCIGCHSEEEEGYPSPMMDFDPPPNRYGIKSKIKGYGCCIFHNLTRGEWAKTIRYKRRDELKFLDYLKNKK